MKLDSKIFWRNAKYRRMELELSQDEIAQKLGFSAKNYSAKERGVSPRLPMSLAEAVASALGTTVEELMREDTTAEQVRQINITSHATNDSHCEYDFNHLPEAVARFLCDKANEKLVISWVIDYVMSKKK